MASTRVTRRRFLTDTGLGALAAAGAGALVTPGIARANALPG